MKGSIMAAIIFRGEGSLGGKNLGLVTLAVGVVSSGAILVRR